MDKQHNLEQEYDSFSHVQMGPPDPAYQIQIAYNADTNPQKINLGIGIYRDQNGKTYTFNVVKQVENRIYGHPHEYLPLDGHPGFINSARNLLFGVESEAVRSGRIATTQTISGTGALSLALAFLSQYYPRTIYIPDQTWLSHKPMIQSANLHWREYPYYNSQNCSLKFKDTTKFLQNVINGSIVLFHACGHNPTGVDPTQQQWKAIAQIAKRKQLISVFDAAYLGFASGQFHKDAWAINYFASQGLQLIVAQSFAKIMGLYGQRVGALHIVSAGKETADRILSQLKIIIRKSYTTPPLHGALIAQQILSNPTDLESWKEELKNVVFGRITRMRKLLREELQKIGTPGTWTHLTDHVGLFSYTGLSPEVCNILAEKHHVYLLKNGRICVTGVSHRNVQYLANSIKNAILEANG